MATFAKEASFRDELSRRALSIWVAYHKALASKRDPSHKSCKINKLNENFSHNDRGAIEF